MQKLDRTFLDRYAALYNIAATIPSDQRFDMKNWCTARQGSECGTAACLAGHAALHPHFVQQGFTIGTPINPDAMTPTLSLSFDRITDADRVEMAGIREEMEKAVGTGAVHEYVLRLAIFWGFGLEELKQSTRHDTASTKDYALHPFWPNSYAQLPGVSTHAPDAKQSTAYLLNYMYYWWSRREVDSAIVRMRHVQYSPDYVHFYTAWAPADVDERDVSAWRTAVSTGATYHDIRTWLKARKAVMQFEVNAAIDLVN